MLPAIERRRDELGLTSLTSSADTAAAPADSTAADTTPAQRPHSGRGAEMTAAALAWWEAGCSVVPVRADGSKQPVGDSWTRYQRQRASRDRVAAWFAGGHPGIGIVTGEVSGNLEMFELEGRAVDEHLADMLRERMAAAGHGSLWERLMTGYVERSPSGGLHLLYRVEGGADRNTRLAQREARDDELTEDEQALLRDKGKRARRVLIETRGEGGFVVTAPSHGAVHASGHPWQVLAGGPGTIPTITAAERDALAPGLPHPGSASPANTNPRPSSACRARCRRAAPRPRLQQARTVAGHPRTTRLGGRRRRRETHVLAAPRQEQRPVRCHRR